MSALEKDFSSTPVCQQRRKAAVKKQMADKLELLQCRLAAPGPCAFALPADQVLDSLVRGGALPWHNVSAAGELALGTA